MSISVPLIWNHAAAGFAPQHWREHSISWIEGPILHTEGRHNASGSLAVWETLGGFIRAGGKVAVSLWEMGPVLFSRTPSVQRDQYKLLSYQTPHTHYPSLLSVLSVNVGILGRLSMELHPSSNSRPEFP